MTNDDQLLLAEYLTDALNIRDLCSQPQRFIEQCHFLVHVLRSETVKRTGGFSTAALVIIVELIRTGQRFQSQYRLAVRHTRTAMDNEHIPPSAFREVIQTDVLFDLPVFLFT